MSLFRGKLASMFHLFRYNMKVTFSARYYFLLIGGVVYFFLWWLNHYFSQDPDEAIMDVNVLNMILSPPAVFLAILLGMQLVLQERDSRTIEVMFAISRSRYRVWLIKAVTVYLAIFFLILLLAVLSYVFFTEFPFVSTTLHAMVPALLFGNLTVLFSVLTRSSNGGALLSCLVLVLVTITQGGWWETIIFPFLNPLVLIRDMDPADALRLTIQNRIVVLAASFLILAVALQRMNRRERLL